MARRSRAAISVSSVVIAAPPCCAGRGSAAVAPLPHQAPRKPAYAAASRLPIIVPLPRQSMGGLLMKPMRGAIPFTEIACLEADAIAEGTEPPAHCAEVQERTFEFYDPAAPSIAWLLWSGLAVHSNGGNGSCGSWIAVRSNGEKRKYRMILMLFSHCSPPVQEQLVALEPTVQYLTSLVMGGLFVIGSAYSQSIAGNARVRTSGTGKMEVTKRITCVIIFHLSLSLLWDCVQCSHCRCHSHNVARAICFIHISIGG